jgi:predicted TPR repeat methyltransferase
MPSIFDQARDRFLQGVRLYEAGRFEEAEHQFAGALALVPGRPSTLTNLGAVRLKLGRHEEALEDLQQALAQEPDNAEALGHCGTALAELGRPTEALGYFERALAVDPSTPAVWMLRGSALKELGRHGEAAQSFRESLQRGGDADLNGFYLAALEGGAAVPPAAPRTYVEALFDGYADAFDSHLVHALRYDGPRRLLERLVAGGRRFRHALDLGCGTGLCGERLRAIAVRVTGVDLSANMLARARATGCYDELQQADVVPWLQAASGPFDCVVAADVFIYVGALAPVFQALERAMPAGGQFCFSLETSDGPELQLRQSLRYAHSAGSVERLAAAHGFRVAAMERHPVREDQGMPIAGLFCWLERR